MYCPLIHIPLRTPEIIFVFSLVAPPKMTSHGKVANRVIQRLPTLYLFGCLLEALLATLLSGYFCLDGCHRADGRPLDVLYIAYIPSPAAPTKPLNHTLCQLGPVGLRVLYPIATTTLSHSKSRIVKRKVIRD
jgi:hypothetical protein